MLVFLLVAISITEVRKIYNGQVKSLEYFRTKINDKSDVELHSSKKFVEDQATYSPKWHKFAYYISDANIDVNVLEVLSLNQRLKS